MAELFSHVADYHQFQRAASMIQRMPSIEQVAQGCPLAGEHPDPAARLGQPEGARQRGCVLTCQRLEHEAGVLRFGEGVGIVGEGRVDLGITGHDQVQEYDAGRRAERGRRRHQPSVPHEHVCLQCCNRLRVQRLPTRSEGGGRRLCR